MRSAGIGTLLVCAVTMAFAPAGVSGQEVDDRPTIGVLDLNGFMLGEAGNSAPLGKAVSAMLITEFSSRDGIRVVERQDLRRVLEEQRLALSGRVDDATAVEVGRLLGAQFVVFGQVSSFANNARMDIRAVNTETSETAEAQKLSGDIEDLLDIVVRIADNFVENLDMPAPSERPEIEPIPVQATIAFSRGVDFEDKGDIEQAIQFYQQTLEIHPDHRDAQLALQRLQGGTP